MVEFWACVGLACFDEEFFNGIKDVKDEKKALETIREKMLRISCVEFRQLQHWLEDEQIRHLMEKIHELIQKTERRAFVARFDCPKPWNCPP
jgi:hypothetical protein